MKITLKLYASFRDRLPAGACNNQAEVEVSDAATISELLDRFRIPRDQAQIVLVNGIFAPDTQRDQQTLCEGDTLAVWPAVAGG